MALSSLGRGIGLWPLCREISCSCVVVSRASVLRAACGLTVTWAGHFWRGWEAEGLMEGAGTSCEYLGAGSPVVGGSTGGVPPCWALSLSQAGVPWGGFSKTLLSQP